MTAEEAYFEVVGVPRLVIPNDFERFSTAGNDPGGQAGRRNAPVKRHGVDLVPALRAVAPEVLEVSDAHGVSAVRHSRRDELGLAVEGGHVRLPSRDGLGDRQVRLRAKVWLVHALRQRRVSLNKRDEKGKQARPRRCVEPLEIAFCAFALHVDAPPGPQNMGTYSTPLLRVPSGVWPQLYAHEILRFEVYEAML